MLFRYKITKSCEFIGEIYLVHYCTKIQKYNPNNNVFKWETCENTTLKVIVELLSSDYCFTVFDNALQEIAETISKYDGVDKMLYAYIKRFIIRAMKEKDEMYNTEETLDNIVLTNGWSTIEIKENE
jgi:hypothetical protein